MAPTFASATKPTEYDYAKWAPEVRDLLGLQGVLRFVAAYDGSLVFLNHQSSLTWNPNPVTRSISPNSIALLFSELSRMIY